MYVYICVYIDTHAHIKIMDFSLPVLHRTYQTGSINISDFWFYQILVDKYINIIMKKTTQKLLISITK